MFDFRARLREGLRDYPIDVPGEAIEQLALYFNELKKWSAKINLIARSTDDEQIVENHFLDSLTLLPQLFGKKRHLLDIGTGAGFPGLVCKAAYPELMVTLVEPRLKRVSFLKHMIRTLGLTGITVLCCRAEDEIQLPSQNRFSHITSRAVTEIGATIVMAERFAHPGTQLVCMKGPRWREELDAASSILDNSSYLPPQVVEWVLPFSKAKRTILLFNTKNTHEP